MSGGRLGGFWRVSKGCQGVAMRVSGGYLEGVWDVSDWCLLVIHNECVWKGCLESVQFFGP